MKKLILIATIMLSIPIAMIAQSTGYVNTEIILSEIPEYIQAQQQLERLKSQFEVQVEEEIKVIENLFNKYQSDRARLNEAQKLTRENEIISKERALKEREQEFFGDEGVMSVKTRELLDPIRELVQGAIDQVAKNRGMTLVFDASTVQGIIFRDSKIDITPDVLAYLGLLD